MKRALASSYSQHYLKVQKVKFSSMAKHLLTEQQFFSEGKTGLSLLCLWLKTNHFREI
jgi:hypothetical protein